MRLFGVLELLHNWGCIGRACNLEIVSATTQIDHVGVVRIAKDALEIARAE